MKEVKCLYSENDEMDKIIYHGIIESAWNDLRTGVPISIDVVSSPEEARLRLADSTVFHIFFVDLLYGTKNDKQHGTQLILDATKYSQLLIIALSTAGRTTEIEALNAGADFFIPKELFDRADGREKLSKAMLNGLRDKGWEPVFTESIPLDYDKSKLALKAVVETIGEENLRVLVFRLLRKKLARMEVFFLSSGLSGASVLRVDCDLDVGQEEAPVTTKILLKVARDKDLLLGEYTRREDNYSGFGSMFVQFIERSPNEVDSHGWYAIGAAFKENAKTMLDWLVSTSPLKRDIERTMGILFLGNGLKDVYSKSKWDTDRSPAQQLWKILTPSRAARIELAIEDLGPLAGKYGASRKFNVATVSNFLISNRIDEIDENRIKSGVRLCKTHGDLHGKNIIVDLNGHPILIDPANIEISHWASDIARFAVDLIVSGLDVGDLSHEWDSIGKWCDISQGFIQQQSLPEQPGNNPEICIALNWISTHLFDIYAADSSKPIKLWEFQLALAVEFLRSSYRQDLPSPKRVLGLIAGSEALRETAAGLTAQ